jgi:hypothetical protein
MVALSACAVLIANGDKVASKAANKMARFITSPFQ